METSDSPEAILLKEGWTKQFLADGARLKEAVEFYQSMDFDVHLQPARAEDLGCSQCHVDPSSKIVEGSYVIYVRPSQAAGAKQRRPKEELW
jgi:hypothetical protein